MSPINIKMCSHIFFIPVTICNVAKSSFPLLTTCFLHPLRATTIDLQISLSLSETTQEGIFLCPPPYKVLNK